MMQFPPGVGVVRDRFETWRKAKKGRERIPPRLWSAAAGLCGRHGVNLVSKWLRLNHTALRDRLRTAARPKRKKAASTFVECVPGAAPVFPPSPIAVTAEYVVEVDPEQGPRVRVRARGAAVADVAALARLLGERAR
ncbi:MAG: hypothetical protein ACK44W_03705 [Planctomycetota bacterium]